MLTGCREYRTQLIELARAVNCGESRRALVAHLEVCADCARAFDHQLALTAAMDDLKSVALPESAMIEARVMAEFDRAAAPRLSRWALVAGIAAAICLGVVATERKKPVDRPRAAVTPQAAMPVPAAPPRPEPPLMHPARPLPSGEDSRYFLQVPYTIPLAPEERTTVVRLEIPASALIAAGFKVAVSDPGETIDADALVSQDGRVRAIRPVMR